MKKPVTITEAEAVVQGWKQVVQLREKMMEAQLVLMRLNRELDEKIQEFTLRELALKASLRHQQN